MMTCHVGTRGIGKTYHLTKELYERYHKKNALVITNYETTFSDIVVKGKEEVLQIIKEVRAFKEAGYEPVDLDERFKSATIAIAIDEAHLIFTSDFWKENRRDRSLLSTMAEARKMQIHLHLTTQSVHKLDKDLRRYVEPYIVYKPLIPIKYFKAIPKKSDKTGRDMYTRQMRYPIPIFLVNEIVMPEDETNVMNGEVISRRLTTSGFLSRKYYSMYDTNELVTHHGDRSGNAEFSLLDQLRSTNSKLDTKELSATLTTANSLTTQL